MSVLGGLYTDMITMCSVRLRIAIFVALPTSENVLPPIITTVVCKRGGSNTIVYALVISRVDYGNVLLFGLPEMLLHKLKMIQNSAARLVTGAHGRDHTSFIQTTLAASSLPNRNQTASGGITGNIVHRLGFCTPQKGKTHAILQTYIGTYVARSNCNDMLQTSQSELALSSTGSWLPSCLSST